MNAPLTAKQQANLKAQEAAQAPIGSSRNPVNVAAMAGDRKASGTLENGAHIVAIQPDADNPSVMLFAVAIGEERRLVGRGKVGAKTPAAVHYLSDGWAGTGKLAFYGVGTDGVTRRYLCSVHIQSDDETPTAAERAGWSEKSAKVKAPAREIGA